MTKREQATYKKHGIETDGVNALVSPLGLVTSLLQDGNGKLGTGVYTWSTLATNKTWHSEKFGDIKGTCNCHCDGCYGECGHYTHCNVIDALAIRTLLIRFFPEWVLSALSAQLEIIGNCDVRIHATGDFENVQYAEIFRTLASRFPNVRFWSYTKNAEIETYFDDTPNVNIVRSIIPDFGYNFGTIEYVLSAWLYLISIGENPHICECGTNKYHHCNNCNGCRINKYVLFIIHGGKYKAYNSGLYSIMQDIMHFQNSNREYAIELAEKALKMTWLF